MNVIGSANPDKIWIRYIDENNDAIIKLRRNIQENSITDDFGTRTEYQYEEVDLKIINRNNLEQYIIDNFDLLFENALNEAILKSQIEEKEEQIKELIDNYKLLDVAQQLQLNINSLTDTLVELSLNIPTS